MSRRGWIIAAIVVAIAVALMVGEGDESLLGRFGIAPPDE